MHRSGKSCLLALAMVWSCWASPLAATVTPRSVRELNLSDFQWQKLKADLPATALALSPRGVLWIASQHQLWRWDVHRNSLLGVKLHDENSKLADLNHLLLVGEKLFAASAEEVFEVSGTPPKIFRYAPSREGSEGRRRPSLSYGLTSCHHDKVCWQRQNGIYELDSAHQTLVLWRGHPRLPASAQSLFLAESSLLWLADGKRLWSFDLTKQAAKPTLHYTTQYDFTGLSHHGQEVLAHTRHTLLLFTAQGDLVRTIPVEGARRLVQMSLTPDYHSYLFHDRLLERHALNTQETFYSHLDIGRVRKATAMVSAASMVAMILDGNPRVFQVEGQW